MKLKYIILSLLIHPLFSLNLLAQEGAGQDVREDPPITELSRGPGVIGMQNGKGITVTYEQVRNYRMRTYAAADNIADGDTRVNYNERLRFNVRFPLYMNPRMHILGGLKFYTEAHHFSGSEYIDHPLYNNLDNKPLQTFGGTLYLLRYFPRNFFITRASFDLNGDYSDRDISWSKYMRISFAAFFGWKKSERFSFAPGFAWSYAMGKPSLYPALMLNYTINEKWGFESIIPATMQMRYNATSKTFLYVGYEVAGASYHINIEQPPFTNYDKLELRKSELYFFLAAEQQLYGWVWAGASTGMRYNHNFYLAPDNRFKERPRFIDNDLGLGWYFNVSLFLIPPDNAGDVIKRIFKRNPVPE